MPKDEQSCRKENWRYSDGTCGFMYFLSVIGAAVYFIQHASGFWPIVLGLLKAFVWPALVIYKALELLNL